MRSVTINKPSSGAKGTIEFLKLTVSPKPRAEGSSPSAPAKKKYSCRKAAYFFFDKSLQKDLNPKGAASVKKSCR